MAWAELPPCVLPVPPVLDYSSSLPPACFYHCWQKGCYPFRLFCLLQVEGMDWDLSFWVYKAILLVARAEGLLVELGPHAPRRERLLPSVQPEFLHALIPVLVLDRLLPVLPWAECLASLSSDSRPSLRATWFISIAWCGFWLELPIFINLKRILSEYVY
ncbi:unnamed protein product [Prunus brigantina]